MTTKTPIRIKFFLIFSPITIVVAALMFYFIFNEPLKATIIKSCITGILGSILVYIQMLYFLKRELRKTQDK